jgi:hypothetical protein
MENQHAKTLQKAEECRALAEMENMEESRLSYLRLAEAYELLAKQEEVMRTPLIG